MGDIAGDNYTNPDDPNHVDDPYEWLMSSLIFTAALSKLLLDRQGIVIEMKGDMNILDRSVTKVIVWKDGNTIKINDYNDELPLPDGLMVQMTNE